MSVLPELDNTSARLASEMGTTMMDMSLDESLELETSKETFIVEKNIEFK